MKKKIGGETYTVRKAKVTDTAAGWYKVEVQLWHSTVWLFVGKIEELILSGRKLFKDNPQMLNAVEGFKNGRTDAFAAVRPCGGDFILRMESYRPCIIQDMLCPDHECLHVAQMMLSNIGAEVNPKGSETLAYTHEYIFGHMMSEILKGVSSG